MNFITVKIQSSQAGQLSNGSRQYFNAVVTNILYKELAIRYCTQSFLLHPLHMANAYKNPSLVISPEVVRGWPQYTQHSHAMCLMAAYMYV